MKNNVNATSSLSLIPLIAAPAALIGWMIGSRKQKLQDHRMRIVGKSGDLHVRHVAEVGDTLTWGLPESLGIPEVWIHFEHEGVCCCKSQSNDFHLTSGNEITCEVRKSNQEEEFSIREKKPCSDPTVLFSTHCNGCYYTPPTG